MKLNKRGDAKLGNKELIELILGAGGVIILAILMAKLIAPDFDVDRETAKSYRDSFEKAIKELEKTGTSSFSLWGGETKMVYFGDSLRVQRGNEIFPRSSSKENALCFCYQEGGGDDEGDGDPEHYICDFCSFLEYPLEFSEDSRVYEEGNYFEFELSEEYCLSIENWAEILNLEDSRFLKRNLVIEKCFDEPSGDIFIDRFQKWIFEEEGKIRSQFVGEPGREDPGYVEYCLGGDRPPDENSVYSSQQYYEDYYSAEVSPCWNSDYVCSYSEETGEIRCSDTSLYSEMENSCLDIQRSNIAPGTDVIFWECNGGDNQKWVIEEDKIKNKFEEETIVAKVGKLYGF